MICGRPNVLITDDDRQLRETLACNFDRHGINPLLAADGIEALDVVQREKVHVVLMDLHMPRISGLEAIQRLHEHQSDLPCILISGAITDDIRARALSVAAYRVMPKPLNFSEMLVEVRSALTKVYNWQPNLT